MAKEFKFVQDRKTLKPPWYGAKVRMVPTHPKYPQAIGTYEGEHPDGTPSKCLVRLENGVAITTYLGSFDVL